MINVGVIGFGYCGPLIARNFNTIEGYNLRKICDLRAEVLGRAASLYPSAQVTEVPDEVLNENTIDLVAIVTPVSTHYELAKKALSAGKHVLVEKPFTLTVDQSKELIDLAESKNKIIMVDHTFLFTGAVQKIKELMDDGQLGKILYYDSVRINLGLFQHDVNVIWDLAPHDLSIMNYLLGKNPKALSAHGACHYGNGLEDVAYLTMYFDNDLIAHFHLNWLSPSKIRRVVFGGEKKMLVWDDLDQENKIKVYDKGVEIESRESIYEMLFSYRWGDMWAPRFSNPEALNQELNYLKDCLEQGLKPHNDGEAGLRVVELLEASNRSLAQNGNLIEL